MYRFMKHIAKLRKRIKYWQQVDSQAVQDIYLPKNRKSLSTIFQK